MYLLVLANSKMKRPELRAVLQRSLREPAAGAGISSSNISDVEQRKFQAKDKSYYSCIRFPQLRTAKINTTHAFNRQTPRIAISATAALHKSITCVCVSVWVCLYLCYMQYEVRPFKNNECFAPKNGKSVMKEKQNGSHIKKRAEWCGVGAIEEAERWVKGAKWWLLLCLFSSTLTACILSFLRCCCCCPSACQTRSDAQSMFAEIV